MTVGLQNISLTRMRLKSREMAVLQMCMTLRQWYHEPEDLHASLQPAFPHAARWMKNSFLID